LRTDFRFSSSGQTYMIT